ncbi:MAG: hypothetical protein ACLFNO_00705 [Parcubacteria group bacterium]
MYKLDFFSKKEKFIVVTILIILIFSFFWFSFRPYQAARNCASKAEKSAQTMQGISMDDYYENCMRSKGYR